MPAFYRWVVLLVSIGFVGVAREPSSFAQTGDHIRIAKNKSSKEKKRKSKKKMQKKAKKSSPGEASTIRGSSFSNNFHNFSLFYRMPGLSISSGMGLANRGNESYIETTGLDFKNTLDSKAVIAVVNISQQIGNLHLTLGLGGVNYNYTSKGESVSNDFSSEDKGNSVQHLVTPGVVYTVKDMVSFGVGANYQKTRNNESRTIFLPLVAMNFHLRNFEITTEYVPGDSEKGYPQTMSLAANFASGLFQGGLSYEKESTSSLDSDDETHSGYNDRTTFGILAAIAPSKKFLVGVNYENQDSIFKEDRFASFSTLGLVSVGAYVEFIPTSGVEIEVAASSSSGKKDLAFTSSDGGSYTGDISGSTYSFNGVLTLRL